MPESLEFIYDHYKDTYSIIEKNIERRENSFFWAVLLISSSIILTLNPDFGVTIAQTIGQEQLKLNLNITYSVLNSTILFASLWFWIRYFQQVLHVENLYEYIHRIEDSL